MISLSAKKPLSKKQQALFDSNLSWAVNIARNIARRMPRAFDPEDLIQAARIGLWKAVRKFQEKRGIPFQGFAYCYVRGDYDACSSQELEGGDNA